VVAGRIGRTGAIVIRSGAAAHKSGRIHFGRGRRAHQTGAGVNLAQNWHGFCIVVVEIWIIIRIRKRITIMKQGDVAR
jgi:hypothetical protein